MFRWSPVLLLLCALQAHATPPGLQAPSMDALAANALEQPAPVLEQLSPALALARQGPHEQAVAEPQRSDPATPITQLLSTAQEYLGVAYRRGGASAETGFDCSGFVRATFQQAAGILLPRTSADQAAAAHTIDRTHLKPGDLVFFNTMRRAFSHVGIYMGDGKFIHSPRSGARVRVEDMGESYWKRRFNGARRVLDLHAGGGAPGLHLPR